MINYLQHLRFSLLERYYDFRFGIETHGQLFHQNTENKEYTPLAYRHIFRVLSRLQLRSDDVFLDYGCGKGRALIAAATFGFSEIIGVELSQELCQAARKNIDIARGLRCTNISVICANAADFDVPDRVTIIYFFNPFIGSVLREVLAKIRTSLLRRRRRIQVIFFNRAEFARETANLEWVRTVEEVSLEHPRVGCGLYELG